MQNLFTMNLKYQLFYLLLASLFLSFEAEGQSAFITTWKTDNPGLSNNTSITIPTIGGGYNYDVDWNNDGTFDQFGITGTVTHDFGTADTYTIRIRGDFPRIYFNGIGDHEKILNVNQWGDIAWTSMELAFRGTKNLIISATDSPDLSNVTSMNSMFYGSSTFNQDINNWNVSNVTSMGNMFREASSFNQDLSNWNVSNVTNMYGMFWRATSFNQDISNWNVTKVTNMNTMFMIATSFNQDISSWIVSNVTDMSNMFNTANSFNQDISNWNVGNVTNMFYMFFTASSFNADLSNWDVSNVTNMNNMFRTASSFNADLSNWDISNVTNMGSMFRNATSFDQDLSNWNVSNVTNLSNMLDYSGLSLVNYDATLNGWNAAGYANKTIGVAGLTYCLSQSNRQNMIDTKSWSFNGDVLDCSSVLPVELLSFTAERQYNQTFLQWQTATEINNAGFEVLHSTDSRDWQKVTFVSGAGHTNTQTFYDLEIKNPKQQFGYFKLKQIDFAGTYDYSPIVYLENEEVGSIEIFPNPASDELNILFPDVNNTVVSMLSIFDVSGKMVRQTITEKPTPETYKIPLNLPDGAYFLEIKTDKALFHRQLIIRN